MSTIPRIDVFGWFDSPEQKTPAHDPGPKAFCPVCSIIVGLHTPSNPLKTISMMPAGPKFRERSYFFRVHLSCWQWIDDDEKNAIESSLIDSIVERGVEGTHAK